MRRKIANGEGGFSLGCCRTATGGPSTGLCSVSGSIPPGTFPRITISAQISRRPAALTTRNRRAYVSSANFLRRIFGQSMGPPPILPRPTTRTCARRSPMKSLTLSLVVLATLSGAALRAQDPSKSEDISGIWKGSTNSAETKYLEGWKSPITSNDLLSPLKRTQTLPHPKPRRRPI